jgi:hydroxyacylglutathione hydrolase
VWTPTELVASIDAGQPPPILDVRSRWEFMRGHVPGAIHVPFWSMPARASRLRVPKDRALVVYCGHGPRAWFARAALRLNGYRDVVLLKGHMSAWKRAGLREESG